MNTLAIDFDKHAAATYAANFPQADVRCCAVADVLPELREDQFDVVLGSPPCQSFSSAGKRLGDKDARDGFPDFIEAIRRTMPRQFMAENVEGLTTFQGGRYWQKIVAELESIGYAVDSRILDAVHFGVPQFRSRVWIWGIRRDLADSGARHTWPKPTHVWPWPDQESMFGCDLLPAVTVGMALGISGMGRREALRPETTGNRFHESDEPSATLGTQEVFERVECTNHYPSKGEERGIVDVTNDPCSTIGAQGETIPRAVAYRWSDAMLAKHPPASPASPASTIQAKFYKGGAEGLVEVTDNPKHQPQKSESPARTLNSGGNGHGPDANTIKLSVDGQSRPVPKQDGLMVRRLTPAECLRLQSGPDDFRWPDKITKTAQYKIIGNGIASGMMHHIRAAMEAVDPRLDRKLDLYCGGGLGACGWHGRYWSHTP